MKFLEWLATRTVGNLAGNSAYYKALGKHATRRQESNAELQHVKEDKRQKFDLLYESFKNSGISRQEFEILFVKNMFSEPPAYLTSGIRKGLRESTKLTSKSSLNDAEINRVCELSVIWSAIHEACVKEFIGRSGLESEFIKFGESVIMASGLVNQATLESRKSEIQRSLTQIDTENCAISYD